ncbi:hypothetical protein [Symbiopectobacterium purcellii]|uniref:hypothetical protein n=1 Tax=Symbiopectobacterium purcellii TaxID=2871826 RepID=UPI003F85B88C
MKFYNAYINQYLKLFNKATLDLMQGQVVRAWPDSVLPLQSLESLDKVWQA